MTRATTSRRRPRRSISSRASRTGASSALRVADDWPGCDGSGPTEAIPAEPLEHTPGVQGASHSSPLPSKRRGGPVDNHVKRYADRATSVDEAPDHGDPGGVPVRRAKPYGRPGGCGIREFADYRLPVFRSCSIRCGLGGFCGSLILACPGSQRAPARLGSRPFRERPRWSRRSTLPRMRLWVARSNAGHGQRERPERVRGASCRTPNSLASCSVSYGSSCRMSTSSTGRLDTAPRH